MQEIILQTPFSILRIIILQGNSNLRVNGVEHRGREWIDPKLWETEYMTKNFGHRGL